RLYYGGNYGWPLYEGVSGDPDYNDPLYNYEHGFDQETGGYNCAVTGGTFYAPGSRSYPRTYFGHYFFAGLSGNWIRPCGPQTGNLKVFGSATDQLTVDLAEDANGSIYYLGLFGTIHRIKYNQNLPPGGGLHLAVQAGPFSGSVRNLPGAGPARTGCLD